MPWHHSTFVNSIITKVPLGVCGIGQHSVQLLQARLIREDHGAQSEDVTELEKSNRFRLLGIASGAAGFLVKVHHGFGNRVMNDESDVGLVDAHAEGDGRHHGLVLSGQPSTVNSTPRNEKF